MRFFCGLHQPSDAQHLIRGFISDTGLTIGTHTPDLNKLQFIEYLERIGDHAALHWECYIPPPDPLWREHAEEEAAREQLQQEIA